MKWPLFKSRVKKTWLWIKHHWYVPLVVMGLIIALLVWMVTKNGAFVAALMDVLENSQEAHKKEIEKLNQIDSEATEKRKHILDEYNKNIERLEKEYADRNESLDDDKKKEIKKLVEESYNDPEKLSRELARLYGFEHG